jgi:hypothetical protein
MSGQEPKPSVNEMSPLEAALYYARRGWKVFPVAPEEKSPLTKNGHHNATCDEDQIRAWWEQWPDANIGVSLADSGLVALDVDSYNDEAGWEAFKAQHSIPQTFTPADGRRRLALCVPASRRCLLSAYTARRPW